jgi:hypothetical protein
VNKTGQTFKKGRGLWITSQPVTDESWSWLFWLLCEPEILHALTVKELPVIEF